MHPQETPTSEKHGAQGAQFPAAPTQAPNGGVPGPWSTGLCDCFDDPNNCFITCCCSCITAGQIAEIVEKGEISSLAAGAMYYCLERVGFAFIQTGGYRRRLRKIYFLEEAPCDDYLLHCCCMPCALCQEYRELKIQGLDPSIGWQANVEKWNRVSTEPPSVEPAMKR